MNSEFFSKVLQQRILPAVTFTSVKEAEPVAEALVNGGLETLEVAFRTPEAAECVYQIRKKFPMLSVGAGTLLSKSQIGEAMEAGAQFGLAPGFNRETSEFAAGRNFPFMPGVMTPSEIELAIQLGFTTLKLFPAEQVGGVSFLKAMLGPYSHTQVKFIPMGGITPGNMNDYLSLENVLAIGGSWIAPPKLINALEYSKITENVVQALANIKVL
jgi:2-dehydro-3-deoxyphosphogluconate aldolase/(4S)-4-hydroxy-2-oxoglutarate aldolase